MSNFKVFDIEAKDWNVIYAIGIFDGIKLQTKINKPTKERSSNNHTYIRYLLVTLCDKDVVYAHNGGRYDFLFLMD